MPNKVGVYLPGLGEEYRKESGEKYARRLLKQLDYNNTDSRPQYDYCIEKVTYDVKDDLSTNEISIFEDVPGEGKKCIYKFYEYQFSKVLIKEFERKNVLIKSWLLFTGVASKLPLVFLRLFYVKGEVGYRPKHRGETFYLFLIFLLMSTAVLFLLPSAIGFIVTTMGNNADARKLVEWFDIDPSKLKKLSQYILNITAAILVLIPGANVIVTSLATEFTCATSYLSMGERKQKIHGQIDKLMEFIAEKDGDDVEITFHSYSYGSIVAIDYLFPYGIPVSGRLKKNARGLVTIGCPFDFIHTYFPGFFDQRDPALSTAITWINVYSLNDALGSNFRKRATVGEAEYSIAEGVAKPINYNYEVANIRMNLFLQLVTLYSVKAHTCYWDQEDDGQSCLRLVVSGMREKGMI